MNKFQKKKHEQVQIQTTMNAQMTAGDIEQHLPRVLATLAVQYLQGVNARPKCAAQWKTCTTNGAYELCCDPQADVAQCFLGACRGGHLDLANLMIANGATNWDRGLREACRGGHLDLANLMIANGATNWNRGLHGACRGGHRTLVACMIGKGASTWNRGLWEACRHGHGDLVSLMIKKGATNCVCGRDHFI
jgi:purine nucleoside permease